MAHIHDKGQRQARCSRQSGIDPPESPCDLPPRTAPSWHANKHSHVHDGRETHWKCAQEQTLRWMSDHGRPDLGPEGVAKNAYGEEADEEKDVEGEEDVGDVLQPCSVVWEVV